ncbi:hypothetical protein AWZ03_013534 [Drosophila navojoa]|uniref:Uncharacterized protein n=1 Tax=Drosophila navojoa TaxID=7232 RepID=A0A484AVH9_DRONA|nr:hypothetical protein AWZ03_013534 [Drosophila navojoa]
MARMEDATTTFATMDGGWGDSRKIINEFWRLVNLTPRSGDDEDDDDDDDGGVDDDVMGLLDYRRARCGRSNVDVDWDVDTVDANSVSVAASRSTDNDHQRLI